MCDLAWHPQCVVELAKFPCKIHPRNEQDVEEDEYIKFVTVSRLYIKLINLRWPNTVFKSLCLILHNF